MGRARIFKFLWSYHGLSIEARICTFRTWPRASSLVTFILMAFLLKGLAGPYQNKHFKIAPGMSLGRRQGEILLQEDNTVSSLHGRVITLGNGQLALKDAGSQNQFLVNNKKVEQVDIVAGSIFQVGQCVFEVVKVSDKDVKKFVVEKNWKEVVFDVLANNKALGISGATSLEPIVRVECTQGPSADVSWFLGFGPRLFGPLCEDIEILEKDSGDISFEISQSNKGPVVRPISQNVLVNKKSMTEKQLVDGDEIQVGSSIFKIRLG